jgi:V8-like Glu-specific endopeptidase
MKKLFTIMVLASVAIVSTAHANIESSNVIYGEDNRKDVFESTDSMLVELSKSTAAMIGAEKLKKTINGEVEITGSTLESRGICPSERFAKQITIANCSGFLVSKNVLITAGHCIKNQADCDGSKWVFDFKVDHSEQGSVSVPTSSIYSCKKIISRTLDQTSKDDYAVIELDRKVKDRKPLSFRRLGNISKGTSLAVIGHPTGLPTKIADKANVRSVEKKYFVANLDTYGGNSGSAVVNTKTGKVEGVLVRGENDYVYDAAQGCQVSNKCPNDGCRGEDVTIIKNIKAIKLMFNL